MSKHPQILFNAHVLIDNIEGFCKPWEIERLVSFYKSYEQPHRTGFLKTLLDGTLHTAIRKVEALGIKPEGLTPQQWGTHTQWIGYKYRRLAIRVLFLRYTQDHKKEPKVARKALYSQFKKFGLKYDTVYRATLFKSK